MAGPDNVFERHPRLTLLGIVVFLMLAVEGFSYGFLRFTGRLERGYLPNQILSGYLVYKSTPHHRYPTIKGSPEEPDSVVDQYGFLSDSPVSVEKPGNTRRIFLMGGSAILGAGQNRSYGNAYGEVKEYPEGIYSHPRSVAGQLERFLEKRAPSFDWEVITAAAQERRYHQSLLYYLETISRFSPDHVVSFDGYNDIHSFVEGKPYEDLERRLKYYVDLLNYYDSRSWLNTTSLLSLIVRRLSLGSYSKPPVLRDSRPEDLFGEYLDNKSRFVASSSRFMQIIDHFSSVLASDDVRYIFVLQPMLGRRQINKELSDVEKQMMRVPVPVLPERTEKDTDDAELVLRHFFDDYLSAEIERKVAGRGFQFLDSNREIAPLGASFEFFTDYCHMTSEANRFIAEAIGNAILDPDPPTEPSPGRASSSGRASH